MKARLKEKIFAFRLLGTIPQELSSESRMEFLFLRENVMKEIYILFVLAAKFRHVTNRIQE